MLFAQKYRSTDFKSCWLYVSSEYRHLYSDVSEEAMQLSGQHSSSYFRGPGFESWPGERLS